MACGDRITENRRHKPPIFADIKRGAIGRPVEILLLEVSVKQTLESLAVSSIITKKHLFSRVFRNYHKV